MIETLLIIEDEKLLGSELSRHYRQLGIDYDQSLKASLEFEYDGVKVPFSKTSDKTPYVTTITR